ncbi:MAG: hypothetical protein ACR2PH_15140, partial [Desulfobulbia bacterium]
VIREEDLKNHMDAEEKKKSEESDQRAKIKEQLEKDNQLARALDVLKSWEILSQMRFVGEELSEPLAQ